MKLILPNQAFTATVVTFNQRHTQIGIEHASFHNPSHVPIAVKIDFARIGIPRSDDFFGRSVDVKKHSGFNPRRITRACLSELNEILVKTKFVGVMPRLLRHGKYRRQEE